MKVERVKVSVMPRFEPVALNLIVESEAELQVLWAITNISMGEIRKLHKDAKYVFKNPAGVDAVEKVDCAIGKIWTALNKVLDDRGLRK